MKEPMSEYILKILINSLNLFESTTTTMEMKKIACATIIATVAATMSVAAAASGPSQAPAPAPISDAIEALPAIGSLVGASILSFFALYMH
ncbi:hypothetical protein ACJIZ3_007668 [Penstemon smallii]|uniref:Arabinogalactan peptide 23-like n=1 Tax=Penstemon smallii TaxID=265156 RepID=A0ABD3T7Y3_9LAMI